MKVYFNRPLTFPTRATTTFVSLLFHCAKCLNGNGAKCLHGDCAKCLLGDCAKCLHGGSAKCLHGDCAKCLHSDCAKCLHGDGAKCLHGDRENVCMVSVQYYWSYETTTILLELNF